MTIDAARPTTRTGNNPTQRIRTRDVLRGEWIKLRSVRSLWVTLIGGGLATIAFGTIFSAIAGSEGQASSPAGGLTNPIDLALSGVRLSEMIIGVVGVMLAAGEFSTGLISTSFAAVGRRSRIIAAKVAVLSGAVFAVGLVAAFTALVAGQAVYAGSEPTVPIAQVLDVALGSAAYLTAVALIGLALGFILRSTAGGIGTMVAAVFIGPNLLNLLPDSLTDVFMKYLPSEAGSAMMSDVPVADLLSPGAASLVLGAWVGGLLLVATALVRRRDA